MDEYLNELRKNRAFKATEILKNDFNNLGIEITKINKNLLKDISLIQNLARGPLFELMAEVIIGNVFGVKKFKRQNIYKTPYGQRKIDLFVAETGVAIEVKSGYGRLRRFIWEQIKKDKYILLN